MSQLSEPRRSLPAPPSFPVPYVPPAPRPASTQYYGYHAPPQSYEYRQQYVPAQAAQQAPTARSTTTAITFTFTQGRPEKTQQLLSPTKLVIYDIETGNKWLRADPTIVTRKRLQGGEECSIRTATINWEGWTSQASVNFQGSITPMKEFVQLRKGPDNELFPNSNMGNWFQDRTEGLSPKWFFWEGTRCIDGETHQTVASYTRVNRVEKPQIMPRLTINDAYMDRIDAFVITSLVLQRQFVKAGKDAEAGDVSRDGATGAAGSTTNLPPTPATPPPPHAQ